MKTGIFSGCFDPVTKGHLWVIEEGSRLFDQLHVVIGWHLSKTCLFTLGERLKMLRDNIAHFNVIVSHADNFLEDYIQEHLHDIEEVYLLRGIRNESDFSYEKRIDYRYKGRKTNKVHSFYVIPPENLAKTSSSQVKELARQGLWESVIEHVPESVVMELANHISPSRPKVINTSTCCHRFFMNDFPCDDGTSLQQMASGRCKVEYVPSECLTKMEESFARLERNGFLMLSPQISAEIVRTMLDPFPYDVIVSSKYFLREIPLRNLNVHGGRYLSCSHSLGPIIVDLPYEEYLGDRNKPLVIEGKHRWLDAVEQGKTTIRAWVGDLAMRFFSNQDGNS